MSESHADTSGGPNALATLATFLMVDGWRPQRIAGHRAFAMNYSGTSGKFACVAELRAEAQQLICYAIAPLIVPPAFLPAVAEFITRANDGTYIGNFELSYSSGEVRCKSSIDFEGEVLSERLIRNTIYPAVRLMETYLPGLTQVIHHGATPREVIAAIEGVGQ
ncbi:MAG: YbjN domain-containing protein [Oscillochloris sp.]|nr:YbjN domain-containing protein [Oscillochloris sp.]